LAAVKMARLGGEAVVVVLLLDMIRCRSRGVPFLQQQGTMAAGPISGKHGKGEV
jgi:hypothetical protein